MTLQALSAVDLVAGYRTGRRITAVLTVAALAASAGSFVAVIGPNGSGKSTLLRTLVGSQPPLSGEVRLDGTLIRHLDRHERARRIAVVLTDRVEPGLLTVGDVVVLGRHPHTGWSGHLNEHDVDVSRNAADQLGVTVLWDRLFVELSDGQRQRVLVARALAQEPSVLVLDEPTAFLDIGGRIELTVTLADLARAHGLAVVVATHDLELVLTHADRVWLVKDGTVIDRTPQQLTADDALVTSFTTPGLPAHIARALRATLAPRH